MVFCHRILIPKPQNDRFFHHPTEILSFLANSNNNPITLLDFGCGTAHLKAYIDSNIGDRIIYSGLDLSPKFIEVSKTKFPQCSFYCLDLLDDYESLPTFDLFILNGVFTEKRGLTFDEMWLYFQQLIEKCFSKVNKGMAFNVMSKNVDWEREDLFHLPLDLLTDFLCKKITRNFIIRNDYGLYEYTVYLIKNQ